MTYGSYQEPGETEGSQGTGEDSDQNAHNTEYKLPPGAPPVTDPSYAQWYYNWYNQAGQKAQVTTTDSNKTENYTDDEYFKNYEQKEASKGVYFCMIMFRLIIRFIQAQPFKFSGCNFSGFDAVTFSQWALKNGGVN